MKEGVSAILKERERDAFNAEILQKRRDKIAHGTAALHKTLANFFFSAIMRSCLCNVIRVTFGVVSLGDFRGSDLGDRSDQA